MPLSSRRCLAASFLLASPVAPANIPRVNASFYYSEPKPERRPGFRTLNRLLIFGIIAAICVVGVLLFFPLLQQHRELSAKQAQLESDLIEAEKLYVWQSREEKLLKGDPEYIETIARDRLDMMKPGETIIHLEPK